jgi:hypothetical protein
LNDSVSQYSEALTVTPSITFGNPGGAVTPGTVNLVRPSSCNAYLPYISSLNAASLSAVNNVSVNGQSATRLVWNDIRFGTLQNAQSLDPRIAYDLNLSASPVNPGPYPINGAVGTYRIQNGALSFVGPQPSNLDAAAFAADQRAGLSPSLTNGTATAYFVPTGIQQITMSFEFDLDGVGNLCNDSVPLPFSFPSLSTLF